MLDGINALASNVLAAIIGIAFIAIGIYIIVSRTEAGKQVIGNVKSTAAAAAKVAAVV